MRYLGQSDQGSPVAEAKIAAVAGAFHRTG
jgi:hypothetical protein